MRKAYKIKADIQTLTEKFSTDLDVLTKELFTLIRDYQLEVKYPIPVIQRNIADFYFTERVRNILIDGDITTVAQLIETTPATLLKLENFGYKSLQEVRVVLAIQGLHLKGDV